MANRRLLRVADLLREELAEIIKRSVHDPRVSEKDFTITRVEISADLGHAKVFVSSLLDEEQRKGMLDGLQHASGFIHRELGRRIYLKTIPALHFEYDPGLAQSQHITDLLNALKQEKA